MQNLMALHIIVSGRVQGVGFRFFTQDLANSFGLTGFVKNLYNGDVEVYAEGDEIVLKNFLEEIKKGPPLSRVTNVQVEWQKINKRKYQRFGISF